MKVPLKYAAALFTPNLAGDHMKMYPRHVVENVSQEDMNCCPEKYIGSGPWTFRSWKKDPEYIFDRNPTYFKGPRPFFDALQVFIVRQVSRQQAALVAGQAFGHFNLPTELPSDWAPSKRILRGG